MHISGARGKEWNRKRIHLRFIRRICPFCFGGGKKEKNLLSRAGNRRQTRANPISANPRVTFFVVTAHSLSGKEREGEEEEEENSPKFELEKDSERREGE